MSDFRARAVCRDVDPELFFPVAEPGSALYDVEVGRARAVCATCPVREACAEYALTADVPYGIFAGLTPEQRRTVRARRVAV